MGLGIRKFCCFTGRGPRGRLRCRVRFLAGKDSRASGRDKKTPEWDEGPAGRRLMTALGSITVLRPLLRVEDRIFPDTPVGLGCADLRVDVGFKSVHICSHQFLCDCGELT